MGSQPHRETAVQLPLIAAGVGLLFWCAAHVAGQDPAVFACLVGGIVVIALTGRFTLRIPLTGALLSIGEPFVFAAMIFSGPHAAAFLSAVDGWSGTAAHSRRTRTRLTSASVMLVSALAAGYLFELLAPRGFRSAGVAPGSLVPATVAAAVAHFLVNSWAIALLGYLSGRGALLRLWFENYAWTSLSYLASAGVALFSWVASSTWNSLALAVALPVAAFIYLFSWSNVERLHSNRRHLEEKVRLYQQMMESFALAIEARDPDARGHALMVQAYTEQIALLIRGQKRLFAADEALDEAWFDSLRAASLLHDVGKIGLPDHLLQKGAVLTRGERDKLRQHPALGAAILGRLALPSPLGPMIRHHHERWDGAGYPDGLKGEAIPLAARVIGLADTLDRIARAGGRSARPPLELVLAQVARESGGLLDPRLADIYCQHAEQIERAVAEREAEMRSKATAYSGAAGAALADIGEAQREAVALYDLARQLGASLDLEDTLALVTLRASELLPGTSCALYLPDDTGVYITPRRASGPLASLLEQRSFARGEGITGWVFDTGEPAVNEDPRTDLGLDVERANPVPRSAAVFPLSDEGGVLGTIAFYSPEAKSFTDDHRRVLEMAGPQITRALRNALLYEATRTTSMTDALTGLPNSRYLYAQLDREMARAARKGVPLVVVVMDLDGFKQVNDTHGHQAGDLVLRSVAGMLREVFRSGDVVCRYAGDEFVALLPETSPEEARPIVQRVQERISAAVFQVAEGREARVGISAGFACFPLDGGSLEDLIHRADKEMYRDKSQRQARQPAGDLAPEVTK